jgi:hypothetical protein
MCIIFVLFLGSRCWQAIREGSCSGSHYVDASAITRSPRASFIDTAVSGSWIVRRLHQNVLQIRLGFSHEIVSKHATSAWGETEADPRRTRSLIKLEKGASSILAGALS